MAMPRVVGAETLDNLAVDDPAATRSRRDLRRVHRAMATRSIVSRALRSAIVSTPATRPLQVLEIGAGDGSLLLGVARGLAPTWPPVNLTLLDAQPLVERETIESYSELGWNVVPTVRDVLDWAAAITDPLLPKSATARWDLIVANLFLHHFEDADLAGLLGAIAARSDRLFACEPRRAWVALAGSQLLGALGVSALTRADAVLSVHAGFKGRELSALWPIRTAEWRLHEYPAGLFSHCFRAERAEVI
ncbi:MAG TPA: hypothetical protein PK440_20435 [Candidatus Accumulibacter phosphatis]|nr:MAG: hypothetical protein AW07_02697 [Candidatus Accumulibacter sp. SK-11]HAY26735.1 hypothetical protein [Accumulibacter sp.]HCN66789.1 hypothetical protein [Accumulibacter sp.]HRL78419.1 hypothetical protein [Candidatus Accumulibacter phosphatis]HRQ97332.1 hypothetical protein [Candidatus Accumulibacter phosphatis]